MALGITLDDAAEDGRGDKPPRGPGLIRSKITVPPLADTIVARPRLDQSLARLLEGQRVVSIVATAGSGKTTAVVGALRSAGERLAWLTVDHTDVAPGRLVAYLEAALSAVIPELDGIATAALADGLAHAEAAGLLAEAVGDERIVLVLDELERLGDAREAWSVIESVVRYAGPGMRIVLMSRREVPLHTRPFPTHEPEPAVGDAELAFTTDEAGEALVQLGKPEVDPAVAVAATGGWVAGILFEAWRAADHVRGTGGEADALNGYLAEHIISQLDARERDFLVTTSLLDDVSARRAESLGHREAAARLAALRSAHLPVSWTDGGSVMRCHPRFREYLLGCLDERAHGEVADLRRAHGRLLAGEGHPEEATEELLRAGDLAHAAVTADQAIIPVVERLDLDIAERWIDRLSDVGDESGVMLTLAELMIAIIREDFAGGLAIVERVDARGERDRLAAADERVAAFMAWCYFATGRFAERDATLAAARGGPSIDAVRYCMRVADDAPTRARPTLTGGPLDALVARADYLIGALDHWEDMNASPWVEVSSGSYRVAALRATGRISEALARYEDALADGRRGVALHGYFGPEILIDAGRRDDARAALVDGAEIAEASGSIWFALFNTLTEAKLRLRLDRDPAAAGAVLDRLEQLPETRRFAVIHEALDTWRGFGQLLEGDHGAAIVSLDRARASMLAGDRILELPTCAVYLAEAYWRAGDEEDADAAADLALEAARRQGSNHTLLQAIRDFPAVVSRRIDNEVADSAWHEIGRAMARAGIPMSARLRASVLVREFGPPAIMVDGQQIAIRLSKSHELLAFLLATPGGSATRDQLVDALFEGRSADSARAYLRQVIHQLRQALPPEAALVVDVGAVSIRREDAVTSESIEFEAKLAEAWRLRGQQRLSATVTALALFDRAVYLPHLDSPWVEERRRHLTDLAADARHEAATLHFDAGRYEPAAALADSVLASEPQREASWRLKMRIADALGDVDGVVAAYRQCAEAMAAIGVEPAPSTQQLLSRLRR